MSFSVRKGGLAVLFVCVIGAAAGEVYAACNPPKAGRRGTFPAHMDAEIPANARYLFEVTSWPAMPSNVAFKMQAGDIDIPGEFRFLFPIGPEGLPRSQYLWEFRPQGGQIQQFSLPYHYFFTFRVAGGTQDETHSAVFSVKNDADTTPPNFSGLLALTSGFYTPDESGSDPGYNCLLGEGTFVVARVDVPKSEIKTVGDMKERRDGILFTAYEATEAGVVGKVLSRSMVWPHEYTNVPEEWYFVIEKDPPPDTKRCYVVRASDAIGNEDRNTTVLCIVAPGPAGLPPGAGAPGFFGGREGGAACTFGPRPCPPSAIAGACAGFLLLRGRRTRSR